MRQMSLLWIWLCEMVDKLTREQRRRCMQSNKAKGTKPEVLLMKELWRRGLRYRKNVNGVPGTPDLCFKRKKVAVFVDGDFWHGRNWAEGQTRIKSNRAFWYAKIERNMARDVRVNQLLSESGWQVVRIWESEIKHSLSSSADRVEAAVRRADLEAIRRTYSMEIRYDDWAAETDLEYGE